jgi:CRP-like cAMP-binding protein
LVSLTTGETLAEAGTKSTQIYFPINALVAHSRDMLEGLFIDTALVGAEGMLGCGGLIGIPLHRLYVAESGLAYRLDLAHLMEAMASHPPIATMCLQGTQLILRKISIELSCSHFHSISQRVARWVLARYDHCGNAMLNVTHQTMAEAMGVRREAVTLALGKLSGCSVSRGHLEITERAWLESECCACYHHLKALNPNQINLPFSDRTPG